MLKINTITSQVLQNCDISDSRHAGVYSVCGLALRLRDMYKWEKGLDPWVEKDSSEILDWIGDREEKWDNLAEEDLEEITVLGAPYDPFDTRAINAVLEHQGFFYGAGYARSLKPTFFLAVLEEKKQVDGYTIYILGRELARDLFTAPALAQDDCILIRKDSAKLFLWDKIFYIKKSGKDALRFGLEHYGLKDQRPEALRKNLVRISADEMNTYIYHELGEIKDTAFDRDIWREIIAAHPHTLVELLARTVKDLLADTNEYGTFQYIMRERKTASLALYVAFIEGLTKELFPELRQAFKGFIQTHDWDLIEQAVSAGYDRAKQYAETIINIHQEGKKKNNNKWVEDKISKSLLAHLNV
ncbi:Sfum_1244 family protein [Thermodesulfobacteriota bacterium]